MTCIVGLETDEGVLLGADSWSDNGWGGQRRADAKLFEVGPYVVGFTTSYRMGQLLRYRLALAAPRRAGEQSDDDLFAFMATEFVDHIRQVFKDGGWGEREKERESGGEFLVALGGRLFGLGSDYQVMRSAHRYEAVGSGYLLSLGSFATTEDLDWEPVRRVGMALSVAERHTGGVKSPFHVHLQERRR